MKPRWVDLLLLLVLLPIMAVTWWTLREIEAQTRRDIESELQTILEPFTLDTLGRKVREELDAGEEPQYP
jgi:hypothetical protein